MTVQLPSIVAKTDTFEIWRRKLNQTIDGLGQVAQDLNESAYFDSQFRLAATENTKGGFEQGKVRNRSDIFSVVPETTTDSFVAGAGPSYPFVLSIEIMTSAEIVVTNITTAQVLSPDDYTIDYTTNTVTVTANVSPADDVDIEVTNTLKVINFTDGDGYYIVYVDCNGTPAIDYIYDVASYDPFPTSSVVPLYKFQIVAGEIDPDTVEDLRTWATVAIDSSIVSTNKLEFREVFVGASDYCLTNIPYTLAGNISVYVDGLRQSQYALSSDYTVVNDASFVAIQFPSTYPDGTSVLVVANQDDHNLSIDPLYHEETITTPAEDTFNVVGFTVVDDDASVAVYVGGVRQLTDSYTVTAPDQVVLDSAVSNTTVMIVKNEAQGNSVSSLPGGDVDDLLTRTENGAVWKAPEFDASAIVSGTLDSTILPMATIQECIEGFRDDVLVPPNGFYAAYAKHALSRWASHEVANRLDFTITNATTFINFHSLAHYVATKYGAVIERPDNIENFRDGHIKHTPFTNLNYITTDPAFQTSSGLVDEQWILVCNEEGRIAYMPLWANQRDGVVEYGDWTEIDPPAAVAGWNCLQVEAVSVAGGVALTGTGAPPVSSESLVQNQADVSTHEIVKYISEHAFSNGAKIYAIEKDGAGDYYIGGQFKWAGGIRATNIVKYSPATNTFSYIGDPADDVGGGGVSGTNSVVYAIKAIGTDIYIAGSFSYYNTDVNQTAVSNIVKWDGAAFSALGTGTNGIVYALETDGTNLFAGGAFTLAGGVANTARISWWDGGAWNAMTGASVANGTVYSMKADGLDLYVGGAFTSINGVANTSKLAKWDGGAWNSVLGAITAPNGTVHAVETGTYGGKDYVFFGGTFTTVGAYNSEYIAKYNLTDARYEPIEDGSSSHGTHNFITKSGGVEFVSDIKFYDGYLYVAGDFAEMAITLPTDLSSFRFGGMARFDMSKPLWTLTTNAQNGVGLPLYDGFTTYDTDGVDRRRVLQLRDASGNTLVEDVNYTVSGGDVSLIVPSTNLTAGETVYASMGWETLAGHGIYDTNVAGKYVSCAYVDGTDILFGFEGSSGVGIYNTVDETLKKFVADHPIFYYVLFEKPDGTEWRIYRTLKGNIISALNAYDDGYLYSGSTPAWQLVDTIDTGEHPVRPQIKAHCINQNTTVASGYPAGSLIGWFVGKTFKYFRTRYTNIAGGADAPTRPTDKYSNTWGISQLDSVNIDASNQIPEDHYVEKWTSFAHAYTGYDTFPQSSETRSGVTGSLDVNNSYEVNGGGGTNYLWTYAAFITNKGIAGYVTLAHTQAFPTANDYYMPPFAALTSGQWAGTYGQKFNMTESSGSPVAALAYHNPNNEVSGGSNFGSRTLYVTEYGFPHEQVNHWNNAIAITPSTVCGISSKFVSGCDFNFLSNRSCGEAVNFKTVEDKDVLNAGKAMIQNESADLAIITATRFGADASNTYGHKNQTSFVARAFTTEFSPAPIMAVSKVVSNGANTVALVKEPINAVWYMEETDTGGYPVSFSENLIDIFCEGVNADSRFFLFGEEWLYVSADGQTWTQVALPVTVVPDLIEMSYSPVDGRHIVVSGGDAMYSDDNGLTWNAFTLGAEHVGYDPIEVTYFDITSSSGFILMSSDGNLDYILDGTIDVADFGYWNSDVDYAGKAISLQYSANSLKVLVGKNDGEIAVLSDGLLEVPTITIDGQVGAAFGGNPVKLSGSTFTFVKVEDGSSYRFYATPDGVNYISFRVPSDANGVYGNITTNGGNSYYISETVINKPTGKLPTYHKVTL